MRRKLTKAGARALTALAIFSWSAATQCAAQGKPNEATIKLGGETFLRYCALCHGIDGGGVGPLADALQKAPPDLTKIAERNSGKFPLERVKEIITNGGMKSHGMMAMLAWGKVFNEDLGKHKQAETIDALAHYIETLQGR